MKNRTLLKKVSVNAAILFSVFSLMLVFGCKNIIDTPKIEEKSKEVSITIDGDTKLSKPSKKTFKVPNGTTWAVVKNKEEIKHVQFETGYQLSRWALNDKNGSIPADELKFSKNTVLYAISERIPENSAHVSWTIEGNGSLKAEYTEGGILKELPMGGKNITIGTQITFTASPSTYYAVDSWNTGGGGTLNFTQSTYGKTYRQG